MFKNQFFENFFDDFENDETKLFSKSSKPKISSKSRNFSRNEVKSTSYYQENGEKIYCERI